MTEADVIAHWKKGAKDAIEAARLLHDGGKYALALFDLHLAMEKARYDDPAWAEREATEKNSSDWLTKVSAVLSTLLP